MCCVLRGISIKPQGIQSGSRSACYEVVVRGESSRLQLVLWHLGHWDGINPGIGVIAGMSQAGADMVDSIDAKVPCAMPQSLHATIESCSPRHHRELPPP